MYKKILLMIFPLFLYGCATTLPINYVPSASIKGDKQLSIGTIRYAPSENGEVKEDQFQEASAAIGDVYLSEPIPKIIKNAINKELIAGGFTVQPKSNIVIEADVTKFLYDWLGFVEVDFYLDINFRILNNNVVIFTKKTSSHQKAPKTMEQDTEAIRAAISKCIDEFFMSAHEKELL